jgi:hypothetical protein
LIQFDFRVDAPEIWSVVAHVGVRRNPPGYRAQPFPLSRRSEHQQRRKKKIQFFCFFFSSFGFVFVFFFSYAGAVKSHADGGAPPELPCAKSTATSSSASNANMSN